ncbi:hypothetical protein SERLADRAFT_397412 [Serpula lacrymans var. lacrymans S7.9]|uniref:Uncharacterized protein n=1 Tax=Serpula lacrymans var. lacrymans (strain S7.9) TaxID=578457 RepID=F8P5J2_SERL9|nr:uncharacterized protein SERLADRAFT_397412 [Serpula lacrymans var. lacrymans S7.9]EGO21879.1 hypothetical protein SERLADRAFT_397412 [Serpula lacrymans var. lacrymans S7.9]
MHLPHLNQCCIKLHSHVTVRRAMFTLLQERQCVSFVSGERVEQDWSNEHRRTVC